MPPASRSELMGVMLLGIALFVLALSLRSIQPGTLALPDYVCPAGAAGLYVIAAGLLGGLRAQALLILGLMWAGHIVYAFLMGCAFVVLVNGAQVSALDALHEGLSAYPPATLLQVAFVIPTVYVLAWPWLPERQVREKAGFPAVDNARSCRELAQGILSVEAVDGATAEDALLCIARKARALLSEEAKSDGPSSAPAEPAPAAEAPACVALALPMEHTVGPDPSAGTQTDDGAHDHGDEKTRDGEEDADEQSR